MALAGAAILGGLAGSPALAQEVAGGAAAAGVVVDPVSDTAEDEIVIYAPIRDAQAEALKQQRNADNLVNIIASDTVGRFPDQNSAAALARLPAVAVQRDQGQERYIQVRGAPNRWTSVSFDGVPVIGVDEGGSTRAYRFDAVPAVILSSIAVNKSLTPDLPAEAVVAQIDLRTFSPFEAKGLAIQGDLGLGWMELGGGEQRQASLRASWSNDKIGFVLGGSHYRRHQVTDNREMAYDADGLLTSYDIRNYLLVRENNGATAGVEWQPEDGVKLFAKFVYSDFKDDEQRNQYTFQLGSALSGTRTAEGGSLVGVPVRGTGEYGNYRTHNYISTIGTDLEGDEWKGSVRLNYTRTENSTYLPLILENQQFNRQLRVSMDYSVADPNFPVAQLYSTVPGTTPGSFVRGRELSELNTAGFDFLIGLPVVSDTVSDSYTFKGDLTRELDNGFVKFGYQFDDRTITGNTIAQSNTVLITALFPRVGMSMNPADYVTNERWDTGFPAGFHVNYIDNKRMRRDFEAGLDALEAAGLYDPARNTPADTLYDIKERVLAGYAMGKWEFGGGQVVAGARIENYRRSSSGFAAAGTAITPVQVDFEKTDIFPSINAKFDLTGDVVLRGSFQRGVARPSFGAVRTGVSINDTSNPGTVSGGNPWLEPEYTWGLDASLEYYLPGDGLLSVSGFHRWVDGVLYDSFTTITDDSFDGGGVDRTGYRYTSTFNGDKGTLYGVEFAYLQQFTFLPEGLDGFGFQGNLAFLDGKFDTPAFKDAQFPGTSGTVVNASLFFEKYGVSARASYQWRDDWLDTLGGMGSGEFRKAYGNLDVSLRYAVTENLSLFADLNNLTDEVYVAYEGDHDHPTEVEQIGRRYLFGIRANF
ncbi:TonB-dependent receptor [Sphingomonas sp. DT-207]|uniref:TonB-dependent receptor n=1 Tax=Sphingomonas sp. DT-207 TaxID=3396167 RepID=UPI003F1B6060